MSKTLHRTRPFRLQHVFAFASVLCIILGLVTLYPDLETLQAIGFVGLAVAAICIGLFLVFKLSWAQIFAIGAGFVVAIALLLPGANFAPHESARTLQSQNNVKQITLALANYQHVYHSFPPQYVVDAQGQPLYSWRVLILPFVEQQELYDRFHLGEPWDSPNNKALLHSMPYVFRSVRAKPRGAQDKCSHYVGIAGDDLAWRGAKALHPAQFRDGLANTLIVVECIDSDIAWTEPRDLSLKDARPLWKDSVIAGYADGRVDRIWPQKLTGPKLRSLLTPSGGELPGNLP